MSDRKPSNPPGCLRSPCGARTPNRTASGRSGGHSSLRHRGVRHLTTLAPPFLLCLVSHSCAQTVGFFFDGWFVHSVDLGSVLRRNAAEVWESTASAASDDWSSVLHPPTLMPRRGRWTRGCLGWSDVWRVLISEKFEPLESETVCGCRAVGCRLLLFGRIEGFSRMMSMFLITQLILVQICQHMP